VKTEIFTLGPENSYSHLALKSFFGDGDFKTLESLVYVRRMLEQKSFCLVFAPFENSIHGLVTDTFDLLVACDDLRVLGEFKFNIRHCLAANGVRDFELIKQVHSHHQALNQCNEFINANLAHVSRVNTSSTAQAAQNCAQNNSGEVAAICAKETALANGLQILYENIADHEHNQTRFLLIAKGETDFSANENPTKTLLKAKYNAKDSSLNRILKNISEQQIKVINLHTRPNKAVIDEHFLLMECEANDNLKVESSLVELGNY
jgi:prephenate dehydratase